ARVRRRGSRRAGPRQRPRRLRPRGGRRVCRIGCGTLARVMTRATLAGLAVAGCLAVPGAAIAHVERPSYWPDPAPDTSVNPPAGGKVPKIRSLASALNRRALGDTRVVCQKGSLKRAKRFIRRGRRGGYDIRPTDHRKLSRKSAKRLLKINKRLAKRCTFHEIQPAVN